jgi:DNA polymerase-3 subunit alpha
MQHRGRPEMGALLHEIDISTNNKDKRNGLNSLQVLKGYTFELGKIWIDFSNKRRKRVTQKRIAHIEIIKPGSNPDVDSDFNTEVREYALDHVKEIHGEDNIANITTFSTLAAKGAFKAMCTIYQIPFAQAAKIAATIPPPIEGVECTIADIFDPFSDRFGEGAEFRSSTSGSEWAKIIEGAKNIEGRNKNTGVHPCGIIMSSKPLSSVIPLQVRQDDGRVVTQWTYTECEDLGLIKMDFLGLDTVDLIQHSVGYIQRSGKKVPNMVELIHGAMDDKKTFEMLQRGETIGVFQLSSPGVQDLLKRMIADKFEDIVATTALYRPGPMGQLSHIRYADRKTGREETDYIHEDFKGSALEEILGDTYGAVVYQEQIIKIASDIAGMTLQEGDDLRKAMGKKNIPKMTQMKPKFFVGAEANGFSEEAIKRLWDTIAEFAKYGFNKSHSVAYAMNAYQAAYLKANYPVEFMAALISQNVGVKEKILAYLQEARRMGLKVGTVDINISDIKVAPDFKGESNFDIVYGISGINGVSTDVAKIIVDEREKSGQYKSVQDLINRCLPLGISNKKVYENLALGGAFDAMGVTRRAVVENLVSMINEAKTKKARGSSLFDMFGGVEEISGTVELIDAPEYPFVEKLKKEADVIGLYLTDHPLSKVGPGLSKMRSTTIAKLFKSQHTSTVTIAGSITEITKKIRKQGGKSIAVTIDDGTGYVMAHLGREIVKGIDKLSSQDKLRKLYVDGDNLVSDDIRSIVADKAFTAIDDIEKNSVYIMTLTFRPGRGDSPYNAKVNSIKPLKLADNGSLPIRIRFQANDENEEQVKRLYSILPKNLAAKIPGDYPIHIAYYKDLGKAAASVENESIFLDAIHQMDLDVENKVDLKAVALSEVVDESTVTLTGDRAVRKSKKKVVKKVDNLRAWPPPAINDPVVAKTLRTTQAQIDKTVEQIESIVYKDTGLTAAKTQKLEQAIEKFVGVESYDFGIFNPGVLEEETI